MNELSIGDLIAIPCQVEEGPFDEEKLVQFDTLDGVVSGFVQSEDLQEDGGQWFVKAKVRDLSQGYLTVHVAGSFFSTNGLANFASNTDFQRLAA